MSTPGNGATARIISPTSGREWFGEVLVWGPRGEPFLRDAETAEVRWFPASWVRSTIDGPLDFDRGECSCCTCPDEPNEDGTGDHACAVHAMGGVTDRACPHHGDPQTVASNILKRVRTRA